MSVVNVYITPVLNQFQLSDGGAVALLHLIKLYKKHCESYTVEGAGLD